MSAQTVAKKKLIPLKRHISYNKVNPGLVARSDSQISFFKSAFPGFSEYVVFQEIASRDSRAAEIIVRPNKRLAHGRALKIG
jgi:hypothetical protein